MLRPKAKESNMADETPVPTFLGKFSLGFKELWNNHKLFLIVFGILIVVIKFREVLIDILVTSAKTLLANTKKESATLQAEQDEANKKADDLVKKAKEEPSKNEPSDDDWYKK